MMRMKAHAATMARLNMGDKSSSAENIKILKI